MKKAKLFGALGLSILMIASASLLTNCKKDKKTEDTTPAPTPAPAPTNTEKLTGKNFKMTAMTVSPGIDFGGVVITDLYAQLPSCFKDNTTRFNTDKSVTYDEGATKCDSSDPQTTTGSWVWSSDEKVLTIKEDSSDPGTSYTIVTNDGSTLKVTYEETDTDSGIKYTYTITFTK